MDFLEKEYNRQAVQLKYPQADALQLQFDYLCYLVALARKEYGAYKKPYLREKLGLSKKESKRRVEITRRKVYDLVTLEMRPLWDKGCAYYPHPCTPNSWRYLPHDLCNRTDRNRARNRNLSDMQKGLPFLSFCDLLWAQPHQYRK